jgi:uracil-DNA glycosylase family 4
MIVAIGLSREQVYIANIVKCRPPGNRDPERDEVETCEPFLFAQIEAIRPKTIVTLGGPATKTLLQTTVGITRLRGTWHEFRGIPVMPTFHPAFVLRNYTVETRRLVWEDLKAARLRAEED